MHLFKLFIEPTGNSDVIKQNIEKKRWILLTPKRNFLKKKLGYSPLGLIFFQADTIDKSFMKPLASTFFLEEKVQNNLNNPQKCPYFLVTRI